MKKSMMVMVCVVTTVLHGAEMQNSLIYNINGTRVIVQKGHISSANGMVGLMVLGRNEQKKLQAPDFGDSMCVGKTFGPFSLKPYAFVRHKDDESASDDDTYKAYDLGNKNKFYERAEKRVMSNQVINIIEPRIFHTISWDEEDREVFSYAYRPERSVLGKVERRNFFKEEAIIQAKADIALCCENALSEGIKILTDEQNREIALDAFGSHTGVPREDVAMAMATALFKFALEKPGVYKTVMLFVKKRTEFALYRKFLDAEIKKQMDELVLAFAAGNIDKFKGQFIMGNESDQ